MTDCYTDPSMSRPTVTLLVPAMNEIAGMRAIMPRIDPAWVDQIVVADGHSTDGTQEYAREHGWEVVVQEGRGGRRAYATAFPHVKGDVVITFSPNGKSVPELIPVLVETISEGYDMVIASRYLPGARSADDTPASRAANWFFTTVINRLHGGHYTDAMVIYRAYRTRLYWELELDRDDAYAPEKFLGTVVGVEPLLSVRAAKRRLRVTEIPGNEPPRVGGHNKFPKVCGGLVYLGQIVRELWYWR